MSPGEEEPNLLPCSRHDRPHNAMKKKKSTRPTVERQPRRCKIASHSPIKASFEPPLSLASAFKSCSLFLSPLPPSMPRFSFPRRTLTREETTENPFLLLFFNERKKGMVSRNESKFKKILNISIV